MNSLSFNRCTGVSFNKKDAYISFMDTKFDQISGSN